MLPASKWPSRFTSSVGAILDWTLLFLTRTLIYGLWMVIGNEVV